MEITSNMIIKADGTTRQNIKKGTGIKTPHIQDDAVTTAKIKNESVASSKICKADNTTGQDVSKGLGIKTPHIQNGAVTTTKIGNVAITEIKIANGAVTESKLGNNSVTSSKIRDGSVGNAEIANGAVTSVKLANDSVTYEKLDLNTRGKLVTNGNNHAHSGGDGAKINHSSLNKDDGRNPHGTTAADVAALPVAGGTVNGNVAVNGSLQSKVLNFYGTGSDSGVSPNHYGIYQEPGPWSHPYPDLVIAYHTGIKIGGHYSYNGTRFYNDAPQNSGATEIMSVGNGDNNIRVNYNLLVNGNVGIGTTKPKTELEVNGHITKKEVAFSAHGTGHTSEGKAKLMIYQKTITNEGASWNGSSFTAPVDGLYFFTVSFVKDAFYDGGTEDDVYVAIWHNGVSKGAGMSGEGAGKRGTGACSLVLKMNKGDHVETYATSDGDLKRHFDHCYFTGFKL